MLCNFAHSRKKFNKDTNTSFPIASCRDECGIVFLLVTLKRYSAQKRRGLPLATFRIEFTVYHIQNQRQRQKANFTEVGHPGFAALIITKKGKGFLIKKKMKRKQKIKWENTYLKLMSRLIFNYSLVNFVSLPHPCCICLNLQTTIKLVYIKTLINIHSLGITNQSFHLFLNSYCES